MQLGLKPEVNLSVLALNRIIPRPLSPLSLDDGLNALNRKTPSAAVNCVHCTHIFDLNNLKIKVYLSSKYAKSFSMVVFSIFTNGLVLIGPVPECRIKIGN
jgi:hypothetical protein